MRFYVTAMWGSETSICPPRSLTFPDKCQKMRSTPGAGRSEQGFHTRTLWFDRREYQPLYHSDTQVSEVQRHTPKLYLAKVFSANMLRPRQLRGLEAVHQKEIAKHKSLTSAHDRALGIDEVQFLIRKEILNKALFCSMDNKQSGHHMLLNRRIVNKAQFCPKNNKGKGTSSTFQQHLK